MFLYRALTGIQNVFNMSKVIWYECSNLGTPWLEHFKPAQTQNGIVMGAYLDAYLPLRSNLKTSDDKDSSSRRVVPCIQHTLPGDLEPKRHGAALAYHVTESTQIELSGTESDVGLNNNANICGFQDVQFYEKSWNLV